MIRLTDAPAVHAAAIARLGLDPAACDLVTPEATANALRRAAGFLCPCPRRTLREAVLAPLEGLLPAGVAPDAICDRVDDTLDALIASGDLLEGRDTAGTAGTPGALLLYAAAPSFLWRHSGTALLLGVTSDHLTPLPEELERRVQYATHMRWLSAETGEDLRATLLGLGVSEIAAASWLRAPAPETTAAHVQRLDSHLQPVRSAIPDLTILDPDRQVRFYRGRWATVRTQSGRFVARRPQAYGNDLWCYIELESGQPRRLVDLPLPGSVWRGCDEAWHLQAAIDAIRGRPQQARVHAGPHVGQAVLEFYGPVPAWAQRRWDLLGTPVMSSGCLFAYCLPAAELREERAFLEDRLWLHVRDEG